MEGWTDASDASLAVGIGRWHEAALQEAYRRYASTVWGIARRVTRDAMIAEEITQEVFLTLWREPERFDPARGSLRTWLATLAHRRAVDAVRHDAALRRREDRDHQLTRPPTTAEIEVVMDRVIVADALASLSEQERRAIELAYFDGLTYREVAARLEEPEGTVKSRIRGALTKLHRQMVSTRTPEA
ncbi:RNA polymerase, sigma-24 subunit, ECF subfamily [Acidimicrobium ferrooxidans DSM 10331]|uniref:RNA polymerase, sigma-24 subunit, ECF subfamily n=1 Tax=Acidimicrobium ferrooxidans (strain DSM 10331 / JCM 15462 / NBRC 103882 / ICP) TaxID=525909 RepID=C7M0J5_ACIFD|nr:sigma-70 family RNA polymerase sigma factor [Acidimicrobium ferrooxidans]ACU54503.1 RNA polymerase, sigma-24 subunit, ECF subfamily [Acidimicrobium ferrooxidans DSM 10331]